MALSAREILTTIRTRARGLAWPGSSPSEYVFGGTGAGDGDFYASLRAPRLAIEKLQANVDAIVGHCWPGPLQADPNNPEILSGSIYVRLYAAQAEDIANDAQQQLPLVGEYAQGSEPGGLLHAMEVLLGDLKLLGPGDVTGLVQLRLIRIAAVRAMSRGVSVLAELFAIFTASAS